MQDVHINTQIVHRASSERLLPAKKSNSMFASGLKEESSVLLFRRKSTSDNEALSLESGVCKHDSLRPWLDLWTSCERVPDKVSKSDPS